MFEFQLNFNRSVPLPEIDSQLFQGPVLSTRIAKDRRIRCSLQMVIHYVKFEWHFCAHGTLTSVRPSGYSVCVSLYDLVGGMQ